MHAGGSRGIVASHNTRRGLSTRCQIRLQTPPMTATSEGDLSPSIDCQCPPSNSVHRRPPSRTVGRREGRGGEGGPRVEFWMLWVHHFSTNSSIRMARAEVERCGGRDRGVRATAQSCFIPIRPAQFSLRRFGGRRVNSCPPLTSPPPASPSLFPTLPRAPTDVVDSQLRSQVRRSKLPTKNAIFFRIDSVVLSRDRAAPSMDGSRARHANNLPTGRPTGALNQSQLLRPVLIYSYSII